jgi:hypothetical protein
LDHVSEYRTDYHYFEEVSAHPIFNIVIFGAIGLMLYLSTIIPQSRPRVIMVFVFLLLFFMYGNFRTLRISVSLDRLTVGFGVITRNVRLDNIDYIETHRPSWYYYGGLGIRFGWDWSTGFIQNYRHGVRVTPKKGRRIYFSTNNPDAIVNIVNELIQKMG